MIALRIAGLIRLGTVAATLAVAGCSSLSEKECLALDWQTVGYEDGVRGYSGDRIADTRKACGEHGVRADLDGYRAGREQGLREYCRPANGYRVGVEGAQYAGVCPAALEPAFLGAYESGHQLHALRSRVWRADATLAAKRRELESARYGVAGAAVAAVEGPGSHEDRIYAVLDATQLAERAGRLEQEIRELENRRLDYVRELDQYMAAVSPEG